MKKISAFWIVMVLVVLAFAPTTQATNIHIRFFESADTFLVDDRFQLFSYAALEGEQITVVAYGLEEGVIPSLTMIDLEGRTQAEDTNPDDLEAATATVTAPSNGLFTFLVSRKSDTGGLIRVMLFEGDPLGDDLSLLDTIDPFLPSRAFFIAGGNPEPVTMRVEIAQSEAGEAAGAVGEIFASRGTEIEAPPLEERLEPVTSVEWENDNPDIFYTLNVRAVRESLPTSQKLGGYFSQMAQVVDLTTVRLDVNGGSDEPEFVPRFICEATLPAGTVIGAGPSEDFIDYETLTEPRTVEVIGEHSVYYQIVDLNQDSGGSWVLQDSVNLADSINADSCSRVETVPEPELTAENSRPTPPPSQNNNSGSGGDSSDDGGVGLAPLGDENLGAPTEGELEDNSFVDNPFPEDDDEDDDSAVYVSDVQCVNVSTSFDITYDILAMYPGSTSLSIDIPPDPIRVLPGYTVADDIFEGAFNTPTTPPFPITVTFYFKPGVGGPVLASYSFNVVCS